MRFSLQALMAGIAFVAVSCTGIVYANRVWAAGFLTLAFVAILFGILAMVVSRGPHRALWIGFVIFAGGYFWYATQVEQLHPIRDSGQGNYWKEPELATSTWLLWLDDTLAKYELGTRGMAPRGLYRDGPYRTTYSGGSAVHTLLIGHSIFAILIGLIGGWMGRIVYERQALRVTREP
jgi:hypothetical protein